VTSKARLFRASGLFSGTEDLLDAGLLTQGSEIVACGSFSEIAERPEAKTLEVERTHGVIFPGLVNAHLHLELSHLLGKVEKQLGFLAWLSAMMKLERPGSISVSIDAACKQLQTYATVLVGEVTNGMETAPALASAGVSGVIFHELFGLDEGQGTARFDAMVERQRREHSSALVYAPTPHAAHSVHPAVLAKFAALSGPLSIHLAEYPEERAYLLGGTGPLAAWLSARVSGALPAPPGLSSIAYAKGLGLLRPGSLVVHLTDATCTELEVVRDSGAIAVLCPRSNVYIESRLPDVRSMLALGMRFALGTDSLASNDSLDVLEEACTLARAFPEVPASRWLEAATRDGASALGFSQAGSFEPGKHPGVYAVMGALEGRAPSDFLLHHSERERLCLIPGKMS
jgi:aminodeoxyfutalosine deaminase